MKANWQMWNSYFTKETCEKIVSTALTLPPVQAEIGFTDSKVSKEVRRSKVRWIERRHTELNWLIEELDYLIHVANRNAFDVDVNRLFELQFTEYSGEDEGYYDWHNDVDWDGPRATQRKLSVTVQLSDPNDYNGGTFAMQSLYLETPPTDQLRNQGTVLVFPSLIQHRVNPVVKGTRYSLVGWMEGPKWR